MYQIMKQILLVFTYLKSIYNEKKHITLHHKKISYSRAQNTQGLRAISPDFSQNNPPPSKILVYGKNELRGLFLPELLKIALVAIKSILTPELQSWTPKPLLKVYNQKL